MKNFYFKLFFSYLFLLLVTLIVSFLSFYFVSSREINREISKHLETITHSLKKSILNILEKDKEEIQKQIMDYGRELNLRITLIYPDGKVLADSHYEPEKMENHLLREEVQAALLEKPRVFKRFSNTLKETMYYYALLIEGDKRIILRVSFFTKLYSNIYKEIYRYLLIIFIFLLISGIVISFLFSSRISENFLKIHSFLKEISSGEFKNRIFLKKPEEFKELSNLLNKAAENLEEIFQREKKEKEEISHILENIKEPLAIIKENGKVSYANGAFLKIFSKESYNNLYYFQILNNLKVLELLEKHLKNKKDVEEEIKIEGKYFMVIMKYLPDLFESLLIFYDITSFKEIIRIKKELISNISHEIKTPLTVIFGYLEILEENLKGKDLEMIKKIKEQVEKLKNLTEGMLYLSSIEEGRELDKFEAINILEPLKEAAESYKVLFEKKGLFIKFEFPEKIPVIMGNKKLLERAFLNLLDNSLKFTDEGGVFIRIKEKENFIEIEFEDTGIGIREEDLPFIFERFYVGEKGRGKERAGFGLGLSILKHIIELHKGKIEVKSYPLKGTIFKIFLNYK